MEKRKMIIKSQFKANFLTVKKTESTKNPGTFFYKAGIESNDEVQDFPISEQCYHSIIANKVQKYTEHLFYCEYNSQYSTFRITGVQ